MRRHKKQLASFFSIVFLGAAMGQAADTAASDKVGMWTGHWKMQVEIKNTPLSHARTMAYDSACSWTPNHGYVLCDELASKPNGEKENALSIFAYSDAENAFKHYTIDKNGHADAPHATVDGNVWTFRSEETGEKGQKVQIRSVYKFVSPVKLLATSEYSVDGQHWTLRSETTGTKLR